LLEQEWFAKWLAEAAAGLPTTAEGSNPEPLTAEQLEALGEVTQKTKNVSVHPFQLEI
jgi:hypothetical protein